MKLLLLFILLLVTLFLWCYFKSPISSKGVEHLHFGISNGENWTISWNPPSNIGNGNLYYQYMVQLNNSNGAILLNGTTNDTSVIFYDAQQNTQYYITVIAINQFGSTPTSITASTIGLPKIIFLNIASYPSSNQVLVTGSTNNQFETTDQYGINSLVRCSDGTMSSGVCGPTDNTNLNFSCNYTLPASEFNIGGNIFTADIVASNQFGFDGKTISYTLQGNKPSRVNNLGFGFN